MPLLILISMNVIVWGVILLLPPPATRSERVAEQVVCEGLAEEVSKGIATHFEYMATRCPATLIAPNLSD